jgi:aldehyde reductase
MERLKDLGLVRSIGVSNFDSNQLHELLSHAKYPPVVNQVCIHVGMCISMYSWQLQIEYHPYVFLEQTDTVKYCAENNIVIEGYSPLA